MVDMSGYYKVTVVGQIENESTSLWFSDLIPEVKAVSDARRFWIRQWHGEPAEIRVERF